VRWSRSLIPTLKENPADAEVASHILMLRAGMIRPLAAGVYSYLPLAWRVLKRIEKIVREEMDRIGAQELFLPVLSGSELWEETGRWEDFGDELFRLRDRKGRPMCLAPTHEEIITDIARREIRSYRDLPQMWYQIQTKFRDEPRPRSAVLRARQFIMKDSYSLDVDEAALDRSYQLHYGAYRRIFDRCGLSYFVAGAASGLMGGSGSQEFLVPSPAGEDAVVTCQTCGYAANLEIAVGRPSEKGFPDRPLEQVHTPGQRTVDQVSGFLSVEPSQLMKSLLYVADGSPVLVLVRGDHEVSEAKLRTVLGASVRPAEPDEVLAATGANIGFIGPVGLTGVRIIADESLRDGKGYVSGANQDDFHVIGIHVGRDFDPEEFRDVRAVLDGDGCPEGDGELRVQRAIELGHIFKLGTKYSASLGATFSDKDGAERPIVMGSYGIGLERIMAAVIEQQHDDDGIVWTSSVAPYDVLVLPVNVDHDETMRVSESVYNALVESGFEVLLDDRDERPGSKFKDADLIGIPVRVTVGERGLASGKIEVRVRKTGEEILAAPGEVASVVHRLREEAQL
jgi:prolyl-tRNA synthetase